MAEEDLNFDDNIFSDEDHDLFELEEPLKRNSALNVMRDLEEFLDETGYSVTTEIFEDGKHKTLMRKTLNNITLDRNLNNLENPENLAPNELIDTLAWIASDNKETVKAVIPETDHPKKVHLMLEYNDSSEDCEECGYTCPMHFIRMYCYNSDAASELENILSKKFRVIRTMFEPEIIMVTGYFNPEDFERFLFE